MANENQSRATTIEDTYPLSPLQQGMLIHTLLDPGSGVDVEQLVCELHEALNVAAFQRAWRSLVARHPVLRTNLRWQDLDEPRQEVHAQVELPWAEQDWRGIAASERAKRIADFLGADRLRGFDLARAPLFRLTLLRYGDAEFRLIWTFHHAVLEGRSYLLALREVFAFCEAFRRGSEITLPLPRPYRDYIAWLQRQDFGKDEAFWRETLKGFTTPTPLAVDHAPHTRHDSRPGHASEESLLSTQITSALRTLAQDNQLTLNTIVQAAWALLLSRYSGEADVVFGVIRTSRHSSIEGADAMIGLFLNTLPLRVRVNPEAALIPWLKEVRRQWMAMRGHEHTPLAKLQGWSEVPGSSSLFRSIMMFENYHLDTLLRREGGDWSNRRFRLFTQTNYPLNLLVYDGAELRLRIDFDRSRIDDAAAGRTIGHMRTLLEAMASNPHQKVGELPLLNSAESDQLLVDWNQTKQDYPRDRCVHQLFEAQAARTPDALAVECEGQTLTYRELNVKANRLAHHLRSLGVGPDVLVGLYVERSVEMVVGLLGILKAGCAYVPLDPSYPPGRLAFMLEDTGARVVVTQSKLSAGLPGTAARIVRLDLDWPVIEGHGTEAMASGAGAENLAYVIYTSGSTGTPKGVQVTHRAISRLVCNADYIDVQPADRVAQVSVVSFDAATFEIWGALLNGAQVVVVPREVLLSPRDFAEFLRLRGITVMFLTTALFNQMARAAPGAFRPLRYLLFGGEAADPGAVRAVLRDAPPQHLRHVYGPSEVTTFATWHAVTELDDAATTVPIGRPIANTTAYVLDEGRQPVPVGVTGELYLGGDGLARGYLKRPELTAKHFVAHPFSAEPGARLYRTGDWVRLRADGAIEFIGRRDNQVKLRGFRIELGEIESVLRQHPPVKDTLVLVQEDPRLGMRIVAYVVGAGTTRPSIGDLQSLLRERLPPYMVPSAFVFLDVFPLTPNGKIDRKALPPAEGRPPESEESYVAPRTPTENALARTWSEVLGVEKVGIHDNFFDLGGHSLMIVRLIYEINRTHKVSLGVPELFRNPTVEQVAGLIDGQRSKSKRQPAVVQLQQGRADLPVYFIYAGPDEFRLAQWMGGSHSVFGIEAPWPLAWRSAVADNRTSAFPTMEQVVAPYVAALSAHTRSSPCVLAGHSFAGLIAFEAAHQFQIQGGRVELVVLFDSWARFPSPYEVAWHNLRHYWKPASGTPSTDGLSLSMRARLRSTWLITRWLLRHEKNRLRSVFSRPAPDPKDLTTMLDEQGMPLPGELLKRLYMNLKNARKGSFWA